MERESGLEVAGVSTERESGLEVAGVSMEREWVRSCWSLNGERVG